MNPPPLVLFARQGEVARITLNRPERHNCLVPDLLDALNAVLDQLLATPPRVLVLAGAGRSFSTGGDVRAFAAVPGRARGRYAGRLVGALNSAILKLVDLPCPVVARVQGAATGGAVGFMLASDLVVMAREAFIAPYYVEVGFSPDGGWTALLPERIGPARAAEIQMLNRHIEAVEALALGLATRVAAAQTLDAEVEALVTLLCSKSPISLAATKALLWPPERRARLAAGLSRESAVFTETIRRPETAAGMVHFLEKSA